MALSSMLRTAEVVSCNTRVWAHLQIFQLEGGMEGGARGVEGESMAGGSTPK